MADRAWRRGLTKTSRRPTPVEAPRQVVYEDDSRLTDARTPVSHQHSVSDLTDGDTTYVTVTDFLTWIDKFRQNHPELTIPDFPPA